MRSQSAPAAPSRRVDLLIVLAAAAFGFILRWQAATNGGLWRDEVQFLDVVRMHSLADMLRFLRFHESHPPLFYFLFRVWDALSGGNDTAALFLAVLLGSAVVPVAYLAGARVFGRRAGLMAACFCAVSATQLSVSRQVRPYALLSVLTVISILFLWLALYAGTVADARARRGAWIGYIVATLALIGIHNWSWLVLAGEWATVLLALPLQRRVAALRWAQPSPSVLRQWVVAQAILLAVFLPWAPTLIFQLKHAGHGPPPADRLPFSATWTLLTTLLLPLRFRIAHYLVPATVAAAAAMTLARPLRTQQRPWLSPSAAFASGILLFGGVPVATLLVACLLGNIVAILFTHCFMIVIPAALVAFCALLATLLPSALCLIVSGLVGVGLVNLTLLRLDIPKSNARALAGAVTRQIRPDDLIVIVPGPIATSFNHYFRPRNEQIDYPDLQRMAAIPFDDLIPRAADPARRQAVFLTLQQAHQDGRRVWLILQQPIEVSMPMDDTRVPSNWFRTGDVYTLRAGQILEQTLGLYGQPAAIVQPGPASEDNLENEVALRFDPTASRPGARRGSKAL